MATTGQLWPASSTADAVGSTILSGTAAPSSGVGNVGDYYLDTDSNILYGPKTTPPAGWGPSQSAYTNQTHTEQPTLTDYSFGNDFQFAMAGRLVGLRLNRTADFASYPFQMSVWTSGGVLLGSLTLTGVGVGWQSGNFATPISVIAGQTVRVALNVTTSYASTLRRAPNPASDIVNGDITMLKQGYFSSMGGGTAPVYPVTTTANSYFVDVLYQAASSGDPWPVAVQTQDATKWTMWSGTQAAYDAITTKDPNTLYVVV